MRWPRRNRPRVEDEAVRAAIRRNVALAHHLPTSYAERLHELTHELVHSFAWEGVGVDVTDEMKATIAANAAFPILAHDTFPYRQVRAVIVRPRSTRSGGLRSGPVRGTYSDRPLVVSGEAAPRTGPIAVSWDSAVYESRHPNRGRNVVIHEFAHKIDMLDGDADGLPPLRGEALEDWVDLLDEEWDRTFPEGTDDVLDPYAFTNHAEFFAVSTETFFCRPTEFDEVRPPLYAALRELYALDPARWTPARTPTD